MGIAALDRLDQMEQTAGPSKMFRHVDGEIVEVEVDQKAEYALCTNADSKLTLRLNGVSAPFTIRGKGDNGEDKDSECFRIEFLITGPSDSEYKGKCIDAMTDMRIGPGNRTRQYIEAFLGRPLEPGERYPWTEALENPPSIKAFVATKSVVSKKGQTYEVNVIQDNALQHVPPKVAASKPNPMLEED